MKRPDNCAGFTLIEIMVAMAISVAIATMAYQGLTSASNGAERSREIMQQVNRLDRTWQIIAADLRHLLPPEQGSRGPRFEFIGQSLEGDVDVQQRVLRFTRRNWFNPMEHLRSDLQEVSYRINEGVLWRDYRPVRNKPYDEFDFEQTAQQQKLLSGVTDIELRFLSQGVLQNAGQGALDGDDYTRNWLLVWPDSNQGGGTLTLPLAVLVRIEIEGMGVSERLFEISHP